MKESNKNKYPSNWVAISADIKYNRANNHCEKCFAKSGSIYLKQRNAPRRFLSDTEVDLLLQNFEGTSLSKFQYFKSVKVVQVIISVAHLDQDRHNNEPHNLLALCQHCHLNHDRVFNVASSLIKKKNLKVNRKNINQLSLF